MPVMRGGPWDGGQTPKEWKDQVYACYINPFTEDGRMAIYQRQHNGDYLFDKIIDDSVLELVPPWSDWSI